jgi:hypothetical protein
VTLWGWWRWAWASEDGYILAAVGVAVAIGGTTYGIMSAEEEKAKAAKARKKAQGQLDIATQPDYKTSSGGQAGLAEFATRRAGVENAIRRGEMTAADAIARSREQMGQEDARLQQGLLKGIPSGIPTMNRGQIMDEAQFMAGMNRDPVPGQVAALGSGLLKGAVSLYDYYRRSRPPAASAATSPVSERPGGLDYRAGEQAPYYSYTPQTSFTPAGDYVGAPDLVAP